MDREESVLGQAMEEKKNLRLPPISFYSYCCYILSCCFILFRGERNCLSLNKHIEGTNLQRTTPPN